MAKIPPTNAPKIASRRKGKRKAILDAPTNLMMPISLLRAYAVTRIVFPTNNEVTTNIVTANPNARACNPPSTLKSLLRVALWSLTASIPGLLKN